MLQKFYTKLSVLTDSEKTELARKALDYKKRSLPVLQNTFAWNSNMENLFKEGLYLVSSMSSARAFCLSVHKYRSIKKKVDGLEKILDALIRLLPRVEPTQAVVSTRTAVARKSEAVDATAQEMMPRHFCDYKHLLPADIREEGEHIADLYTQMTDAANILDQLCNNPSSLKKDRGFYATRLCNIENMIMNVWARIDVAYTEAVGKSVSQDYKDWLEEERKSLFEKKEKPLAEMTKVEIENINDLQSREEAKAARIARNKKFLRKSDRKDEEHHRQNLIEAAQELHEWGILLSDKQVVICQQYGFDVPVDWRRKSPEERKTDRQRIRNEERREKRASEQSINKQIKTKTKEELKAPYKQTGFSLFTEEEDDK